MDLLLNRSIVPWYSFTWDDFIHTLEILLCSSPVLIDQIGVYVSSLKVELFNTKVMQHPFPSCHGSYPKLAVPGLLCCCFAVPWQLCGWGEVAAAVRGTGFPEFPSSHNSFCSRGFALWEFSVIVTENEAYKECDLKNWSSASLLLDIDDHSLTEELFQMVLCCTL